jgi:hypothetical protein
MINTTKCLEKGNRIFYKPRTAMSILKRNCLTLVIPKDTNIVIISAAGVYSSKGFKAQGKYPEPWGDEGIYMATPEGRSLAVVGFNIIPEENYFSIEQMKGISFEQARGWERTLLSSLNWERTLLDVVESLALRCEASVRVLPAAQMPEVVAGAISAKKMAIRYDLPALERNYAPYPNDDEVQWYVKSLNQMKRERTK